MAPPILRTSRPSARPRLAALEGRLMCGEAGLLSAAVVSEIGVLGAAESTQSPAPKAAAATDGDGGTTPPVQPLPADTGVISGSNHESGARRAEQTAERPEAARADEPILALTSAVVPVYDLARPDQPVGAPADSAGPVGVATASLPAGGNDSAPAVAPIGGGAPLMGPMPPVSVAPSARGSRNNLSPVTGTNPDSPARPVADPVAAAPSVAEVSRLTARNRNSPTMSGGWNPALRGVLVMNDGSRWFAAETGGDVQVNSAMVYYRLGPAGWKAMGSVALPPGVQQNLATVTNGRQIYSYGCTGGSIVEVWFDTTRPRFNLATGNTLAAGGRPIATGTQANYIGAAWHDNTRVVWWTEVGAGGTGGRWLYAYNSGRGWNGPVVSGAGGYADVGYVRGRFDAAGRLRLVGEAYLGTFPGGQSYLVAATLVLGNACQWVPVHTASARSPLDLWREEGAATQFLYRISPTRIGYSFGSQTKTRPTVFKALEARFVTDGHRLGLVLGYRNSIEVRLVPREAASGWIDWAAVPPITLDLTAELKGQGVSAIWPADESRQPHASDRLEFAVGGGYPARDNLIYYVTL